MSIRHPYNPVFPVILVSSVVFSILSLPFFLYRSQTDAATSNFYQGFQPVVESKNRDLTIRYIGAAMVLSVVTGISTIEVQRKRRVHRSATTKPAAASDREAVEAFAHPVLGFDAEFEVEPIEPAEPPPAVLTTERAFVNDADGAPIDLAPFQSGQELIAEYQNYATCRIWVEHLHRRLFAIQVDGQFYSFFRLLPTQESARQTAFQLSENQTRTVITPVEQDFAIWIWQPEAELEA